MITTLNNELRVYQVVNNSNGRQVFCNIEDLNEVVKGLNCHESYFKICLFENHKPFKVSKKFLKGLFMSAGLTQEFHY